MSAGTPPPLALAEFMGSTTRHTRRVEIYESDGVTRWSGDTVNRLIDGSITVDYDRAERRTIDLVLANGDKGLVNAPGQFWYDKIIKIFRGVEVNESVRKPSVYIITDYATEAQSQGPAFRDALIEAGFDDVRLKLNAATWDDISSADVVVGLGEGMSIEGGDLLKAAYLAGKSVYVQAGEAIGFIENTFGAFDSFEFASQAYVQSSLTSTHPASKGWVEWPMFEAGLVNYAPNPVPANSSTFGWTAIDGSVAYVANVTGQGPAIQSSRASAATGRHGMSLNVDLTYRGFGDWMGLSFNAKAGNASLKNLARVTVDQYDIGDVLLESTEFLPEETLISTASMVPIRLKFIPNQSATRLVVTFATDADETYSGTGEGFSVQKVFIFSGADENHVNELFEEFFDPTTVGIGDYSYSWLGVPFQSASVREHTYNRAYSFTTSEWTPIALSDEFETRAFAHAFSNTAGGKAFAVTAKMSPNQYDYVGFINMIGSAFTWLNNVKPLTTWECQIGEFMIDRISETNFPKRMTITGRDYAKKCLGSKYLHATRFVAGMAVESIIHSIAGAAGITKRSLPATGKVVDRDFFFDRDVARWDAMKEIATAYGYELFFDATGTLVMREYRDPAAGAPTLWFETGPKGSIAKYEKSTSDSRLFNSIGIYGESSDADTIPVSAEAKNEDENSATSIYKIGERVMTFSSSFVTTQAQADELALAYLSLYSLEEYEIRFDSLLLPWLEVGDVIGFRDPDAAPDDPDTFMLSSITLPLSLGPMSGTGKRIIRVEA